MRIFRVDDGSVWHIAAEDHAGARVVWLKACITSGYRDGAAVVDEFDEPEITVVQPAVSASVRVRSDDVIVPCDKCRAPNKQPHYDSLLLVFRNQTEPGVLCNSEW